jgi:hypothetical protein
VSVFASSLETSLTDAVPASNYASDCFVTSEAGYNDVLVRRVPSGAATTGAYVGVGPDQNFIYAGVLRPRLVLIVDARMDNLLEHLVFKLLMERAETPLEYLAALFSRELPVAAPVVEPGPEPLLAAFDALPVAAASHESTVKWIKAELSRRWPPLAPYLDRVDYLCGEFFTRQLDITSVSARLHANLDFVPTLREVIGARETHGVNLHYLTDPGRYGYVRSLQVEDRIIPVLGNLSSPRSIAQVNDLLRQRGEAVSHLYLSNLEEFLLGRYLMDGTRIARRPNPAGLLSGEHGAAYRELLNRIRELDLRDDAALIRFFFPGTFDGFDYGHFPYLLGDLRLLKGFLAQWQDELPPSVLHTYL